MKPFLRWAGSKAQLLPTLQSYWNNEYSRYVEPFCGSASLFFSLQPKAALLSDLNYDLICTLSQIQCASDAVFEILQRYRTDEASYYEYRSIDPSTLSPKERAARFIYLNALCFNGLYRTNAQGHFNVPYGSKTRIRSLDATFLRGASSLLKNAMIEHSDFEDVVDSTRYGDFLYLDPPYVTGEKRAFTEYGGKVFSERDVLRLVAAVERAEKRGVKFVLSYADTPEIIELGKKWICRSVETRRNIAGFAGSRKRVKEVLITNIGNYS